MGLYAKFINLLKNIPTVRTLLPLSPVGIEDPEDETFTMTSVDGKLSVDKKKAGKVAAKEIENDVIFDQAPEAILNSMLPLYLNSVILNLLYEAQASELGSRMVAMKAATDNAKEVAKKLNVIYNRKRQAAITAEIAEISAGAAAIDEMDAKGDVKDLSVLDTDESVTEEFLDEIEKGDAPQASVPMGEVPERLVGECRCSCANDVQSSEQQFSSVPAGNEWFPCRPG